MSFENGEILDEKEEECGVGGTGAAELLNFQSWPACSKAPGLSPLLRQLKALSSIVFLGP
jgi:hypothetical protein